VIFAQAAATLFLCGVIWMVQLVHYPLFAKVGSTVFVDYERDHQHRISWIVVPAMLVELATALWLAWKVPAGIPPVVPRTGIGMVVLIWLATWLGAVPCHRALARGFDPGVHARLLRVNWLRTAAWTIRGGLALWMVKSI
jgi:hypothetical protein